MYVLSPPEQHHKIGKKKKKKQTHTVFCHWNMKGCLRFYTFILLESPYLAKHTYGLSPPQQHHKIAKKNRRVDLNNILKEKKRKKGFTT
jgi:hypothetical protein